MEPCPSAGGQPDPAAWPLPAYSLLVLLTPVPYILDLYGLPYLILVCALNALLVGVMFSVRRVPDTSRLRQVNRFLKAGMVLGLLAILAGAR